MLPIVRSNPERQTTIFDIRLKIIAFSHAGLSKTVKNLLIPIVRAGIEATISQYDARTGVKNLRVRGFKAVRFCAVLLDDACVP